METTITAEEVRSRAEAYYRTILDGIYAVSRVDHGGRMDGYLAEQGRMAQMAPHEAPDELLTVVEVGKVLGIGKNAANRLVQRGIIRGLNLIGMKVRRRELESWMAAMEGMDLSDPAHPVPLQRGVFE